MTFIALETTGDLWLTTAVLIAAIISMQVTREFFGYTFATWRFHLRGETIRSAADVGWIRDLTVGQMMRADVRTTPAEAHDRRFPRSLPARLDQPGDRGRRRRPLCRHGAGGRGACRRPRRRRQPARAAAPQRPHAAAADDGAGSDRRRSTASKRKRCRSSIPWNGGRSSGCSAKRTRCGAIRRPPSGSGGNCSATSEMNGTGPAAGGFSRTSSCRVRAPPALCGRRGGTWVRTREPDG